MVDIFISYASEDRERVVPIVETLEQQGWSTFWDWKSIPVGKSWRQFINEGLNEAKCVLVLWSKKSIESEWVIEEADYGKSNKVLVPALIDDVRPPIGFGQIQAANLSGLKLDKNYAGFVCLVDAIEAIIGQVKSKHEVARRKTKQTTKLPEKSTNKDQVPLKAITNNIGMKFVFIPVGRFIMGSENKKFYHFFTKDESPAHNVNITRAFYMQTTQVTQGQWKNVMGNNPSHFKECGDDCPVEEVSWIDAQKFIAKINEKEDVDNYRLPTEAEWEYACRAGTTTEYSFGDDPEKLDEYAWHPENSEERTHSVATKKPNAWGLYDMHGNVWEWCQDWYDSKYYRFSPEENPQGPNIGTMRVIRGGGCWWGDPSDCRSANRDSAYPDAGHPVQGTQGFRLARSILFDP
jgi:formylglycine-generating enzyme required for sulfatase activity